MSKAFRIWSSGWLDTESQLPFLWDGSVVFLLNFGTNFERKLDKKSAKKVPRNRNSDLRVAEAYQRRNYICFESSVFYIGKDLLPFLCR